MDARSLATAAIVRKGGAIAMQLDTTQVQLDATQWCGASDALVESITSY